MADLTSDANLQGYWQLEEASNTTRNDSTANANHLTDVSSNVARTADHIQGSYAATFVSASSCRLDRSDANLSANFIGKTGTTNTAATMGCWFNLTSTSSDGQLITKGDPFGTPAGTLGLMWSHNGFVQVNANLDSAARFFHNDTFTFSTGVWYHAVGRIDDSSKKLELFLNGSKQSGSYSATSTTLATNSGLLEIGRSASHGYINALIDEAWVFNRALSDAEILGVYLYGLDDTRKLAGTIAGAATVTGTGTLTSPTSGVAISRSSIVTGIRL